MLKLRWGVFVQCGNTSKSGLKLQKDLIIITTWRPSNKEFCLPLVVSLFFCCQESLFFLLKKDGHVWLLLTQMSLFLSSHLLFS